MTELNNNINDQRLSTFLETVRSGYFLLQLDHWKKHKGS